MEETFSHQDNSHDNQAQLEPHLSLKESLILPTTTALSAEEVEIFPTVIQVPSEEPQILSASPRRSRLPSIKELAIVLLVLLLFLTGASAYAMERPSLPSGSASISITPASQHMSKTYTTSVTVDSTDPTLNLIGAHTVRMTTPMRSLTVPATGSVQEPATYASGVLRLGDGDASRPIPAGEYSVQSNSGVDIAFYISSPIPTNSRPDISARATHPGPGGNIPQYDINNNYNFPDTEIYIINYQPFTGGRNSYDVTSVSQTDIDSATSQLTKQLMSTLSPDQAELKKQLASSEQLLDPTTIECQPSVKANHRPNDQANSVTVTGSMTCRAIAYTLAKLEAYGASLLAKDASAQWGGNYILVGPIREKLSHVLKLKKTTSFTLTVQGLYSLQLNPSMSAHLASLIAGKTQADARALLLQQAGVTKVDLHVSGGLGTALPSSPKDIHIMIVSGQG